MPLSCVSTKPQKQPGAVADVVTKPPVEIEVGLLTGCQDRHYAFGLAMAVCLKGVRLDVIVATRWTALSFIALPNCVFLNLRGSQRPEASFQEKISSLLAYYARLLNICCRERGKDSPHLWNNKFELFDRTLLMLYYKAMGKRLPSRA